MDGPHAASLARIPLPYSIALRLRDAGIDDALIAQCIGVDIAALTILMTIAEAKLAAAEDAELRDERNTVAPQHDSAVDR